MAGAVDVPASVRATQQGAMPARAASTSRVDTSPVAAVDPEPR